MSRSRSRKKAWHPKSPDISHTVKPRFGHILGKIPKVRCTIGSDGRKYYFSEGKRIKNTVGDKAGVPCNKKIEKKPKRKSKSKSRAKKGIPHAGYDSNCIDRSLLSLKNVQVDAVEYINTHKSELVVHEMGLGKTLIAVTASQCYIDEYPNNKVVVISPAGLIDNFKNEMIRYGVDYVSNNYEFYSFEKFMKMKDFDCKHSMLIIDEVHNLRAYKKAGKAKARKFRTAFKCAMNASKVLLLTGTPVVNKIDDLIPIVCLLEQRDVVPDLDKSRMFEQLMDMIAGKVSFSKRPDFDPDFPTVTEEFVDVKMSKKYAAKYNAAVDTKEFVFKNPMMFYNGYRRAVNKVADGYVSEKMDYIFDRIKKNGKYMKTVIYTNWLEYGTSIIIKELNKHHIGYGIISGEVPKAMRTKIIEAYNTDKIKMLIITKAGSEGINLLGTRFFFVFDPPWNPASLNQLKCRAIRYKSHAKLPENERNITVVKLVLVHHGKTRFTDEKSGDAILYEFIEKKYNLTGAVETAMQEVSI